MFLHEQAAKVPVSETALLQRIKRKLAQEGEQLRATRGERWRGDLGDCYIVDKSRNTITAQHVEPEKLGRELGVLQAWEEVR
jgi:hypothetical protein